jgi:soluble lytic murein transglycosylase-like protein
MRWLWMGTVFLALPAAADIYKYVDATGQVYYTDKPKHAGYRLLIRTPKPALKLELKPLGPSKIKYAQEIEQVARKYGLDPKLLHAVIRAESAYDPTAVSPKGAVGLMQLMPDTAARYGAYDRYDPFLNLEAGARYLRDLLSAFGDVKLAVAAYNAGEGAVRKYGNRIPPYFETQAYVSRVLKFYESL